MEQLISHRMRVAVASALFIVLQGTSLVALAQTSPFDTGADSLVSWALGIAVPIAALIVIGLGIAAAVGRITWGVAIGCIVGIAAIFGSTQIVTWIQDLFGV